MTVAAELLGVPREIIPASVAGLQRYIADVRPELRRTPAAAESMSYLLDPPGLDEDIAELWRDVRDAAVAALPGWARELYGYPAPPAADGRAADRDPPGSRRTRRGVPRRTRGARGAAAAGPADAFGGEGVTRDRTRLTARREEARDRDGRGRRLDRGADPAARQNGRPVRGRQAAGAARARDAAAGGARRGALRDQRSAAVHQRGRAPAAAAERPGAADRRGRRHHAGGDEGRADEAGPDGQLRRQRPGPGGPPDAEQAAGQRAADEP